MEPLSSVVARLGQDEQEFVRQRLERAREMFGGTDALNHFRRWKAPEES
jgi:pyrroloquinoline quinone (PQQ) biosynthesis protein C